MARRGRGPDKHLVHGEWMTEVEAAKRLGRARITIQQWRYRHRNPDGQPALLEEAWDYYVDVRAGRVKRWMGRQTIRYRVGGRMMSRNEAAEELEMPVGTLDSYMHNHRCGLDAAWRHYTKKREDAAVKKLLEIIQETTKKEDHTAYLEEGTRVECANRRCRKAFVIGERNDGKPDRRTRFCCAACEKQYWRDVTRHKAKAGNGTPMTEFHSAAHYASWERSTSEE